MTAIAGDFVRGLRLVVLHDRVGYPGYFDYFCTSKRRTQRVRMNKLRGCLKMLVNAEPEDW